MRLEVISRLFPGKCVFLPSAKTPEEGGRGQTREAAGLTGDRAHIPGLTSRRAHMT